jgi:hypothetical protein
MHRAGLAGWTAGGSVRLKRPMRPMGGMCALSALCALWVGFGSVRPGFRLLLAEELTRAKAQKNAFFEKRAALSG